MIRAHTPRRTSWLAGISPVGPAPTMMTSVSMCHLPLHDLQVQNEDRVQHRHEQQRDEGREAQNRGSLTTQVRGLGWVFLDGTMTPDKLIRALRSPFSGPTTTGARGSALPPDLLREAGRRLGIVARLVVALAVINLTLAHTLFPRLDLAWSWVADVIVSSVGLLSLGVFLYTRRGKADPASFVTLGLAYEVVVAAAVATVEHSSLSPTAMTAGPTVSRLALVILIFSAIVPSTPSRTLVVALIAASMDPLAMATTIAAQHLSVPPAHLLWMHIPDYMAAAVATLISNVITRLGREVRDARELGSYRLGELLGRGGMGEVYVAQHRMLARPAAIKLIRPEKVEVDGGAQAERAVQRLQREAEAAASLRSPHTVEL